MVIAAANFCCPWLVFKCSLCNHAPAISSAFVTRNFSGAVFQHVAVSTCCNCKKILASGAIVEDKQLQCQLHPVMLYHGISQHVMQLWKMSNCSANNPSPFPLAGNVKVATGVHR